MKISTRQLLRMYIVLAGITASLFLWVFVSRAQDSGFPILLTPQICTNLVQNGQMEGVDSWVFESSDLPAQYINQGYADLSGLALGPTDETIPPVPSWATVYQPVTLPAGNPLRLSFMYTIETIAFDEENIAKLYVDFLDADGNLMLSFADDQIRTGSVSTYADMWHEFEATLSVDEAVSGFLVLSVEYDGISDRGLVIFDNVSLCPIERAFTSSNTPDGKATWPDESLVDERGADLELDDSFFQPSSLIEARGVTDRMSSVVMLEETISADLAPASDTIVNVETAKLPAEEPLMEPPAVEESASAIILPIDIETSEPAITYEADMGIGETSSLFSLNNVQALIYLLPILALFFFVVFMVVSIVLISKGWELFFPK